MKVQLVKVREHVCLRREAGELQKARKQNISSNISITEKYLPVIIYEASDTNRPLLADSKVKSLDLPTSPPGGYAFWRQSTSSVQVSARSIIKIS